MRFTRLVTLIALSSLLLCGQTPKHALTVDDVVKMTTAGLSDDVIVSQIRKNEQAFD